MSTKLAVSKRTLVVRRNRAQLTELKDAQAQCTIDFEEAVKAFTETPGLVAMRRAIGKMFAQAQNILDEHGMRNLADYVLSTGVVGVLDLVSNSHKNPKPATIAYYDVEFEEYATEDLLLLDDNNAKNVVPRDIVRTVLKALQE